VTGSNAAVGEGRRHRGVGHGLEERESGLDLADAPAQLAVPAPAQGHEGTAPFLEHGVRVLEAQGRLREAGLDGLPGHLEQTRADRRGEDGLGGGCAHDALRTRAAER
jgi:hypothetical protein